MTQVAQELEHLLRSWPWSMPETFAWAPTSKILVNALLGGASPPEERLLDRCSSLASSKGGCERFQMIANAVETQNSKCSTLVVKSELDTTPHFITLSDCTTRRSLAPTDQRASSCRSRLGAVRLGPPSLMVQRGVFIPACDEAELLPGAIDSLAQLPYSTLLVLVVNQRINASDAVKTANRQTVEKLLELPHQMEGPNRYRVHTGELDIILLDHQSEGFELGPKQGVGRARHIGASTLVEEWQKGQIEYPIFWSTDADARFAADYLDSFKTKADVYPLPYTHIQASKALRSTNSH